MLIFLCSFAFVYLITGFLWRGRVYLADYVIEDRRYHQLPVKWPKKWTKKLVGIYVFYSLGWLPLDFIEISANFMVFCSRLPNAIKEFRDAL